jgi:hypothetical protein
MSVNLMQLHIMPILMIFFVMECDVVTLIQRKTFWRDVEDQNIKMYIDFFKSLI